MTLDSVSLEPGFIGRTVVAGTNFHTINGLAFGPDGRLYLASVIGESIFALDLVSGSVEVVIRREAGHADDLLFLPNGDMVWNATLEGAVRIRTGGRISDLATNLPGVNSIALTRDGKRLFVGQVFFGEGLWEIDLNGKQPPRLVTKDTGGGLNAFHFGPDEMIYAPTWEKGQLVRIDPETGDSTVLVDGFQKPGAVRFDAQNRLFVLDDATGELFAIDRKGSSWSKRFIVGLATSTDNMMPGPDGLIYISNMADNTIHTVDADTSLVRIIAAGGLGFPRALAMQRKTHRDQLHVADGCAYRVVDPLTGVVRDVARAVASKLKFPTSVSVNERHVLLTSEAFGVIQVFDHNGKLLRDVQGFHRPGDAIECEDGSFIVSEPEAGRVVHKKRWTTHTLIDGLTFPSSLADAGNGFIYIAESMAGRVLRTEIATGKWVVVADGLDPIRALALTPESTLVVLTGNGTLLLVDTANGDHKVVASGLPVGYLNDPYPRSGSIAVSSDHRFYVACDVHNAIYEISGSLWE